MAHTNRDQKKLLTRVRRIKGQAEAIEKALDQGKDCTAILQQIAAIRGAINLSAVVSFNGKALR